MESFCVFPIWKPGVFVDMEVPSSLSYPPTTSLEVYIDLQATARLFSTAIRLQFTVAHGHMTMRL
jgi:hypothetical protein